MRILVATGIFPPDIGGPATYSEKVAEELIKRGHAVKVLTYANSGRREIFNFQFSIFNVFRQWPAGLRHFIYFLKVLRRGRDVDLIYLQDPVSAGLPTALANLFLRKRLALKIVGDYAWECFHFGGGNILLDEFYPFESSKYPLKIRILQKIQTWVAKRADKIITPSEYLKGIVKKWGITENKINVIYNAVNIMTPDVQNVRHPMSQGHRMSVQNQRTSDVGSFTIVSVGRLVPWKGYGGLIEVFSGLYQDYPNLRLKIIGAGPQISNIQFLISKFHLEGGVQLLGSLSRGETLKEMAKADLFVLNTAYEGLSHVILESLAVGTPVVTTTAGGNPEVIKDGWNGILVKYNDLEALKSAIMKMVEDKDFREICIENGFKSLDRFNEDVMIKRTFDILTSH